ncbi:MAG TPA: kelch repeat-containing protein, partial [Anaeromyxobacteraceae bacterium]
MPTETTMTRYMSNETWARRGAVARRTLWTAIAMLGFAFAVIAQPSTAAAQAIGTWSTLAPMPTARHGLAAAAANGKVYAIGGYALGQLGTVEAYDPVAGAWSTAAPLPTPRHFLAAATVNGTIYAVGGMFTDFSLAVTDPDTGVVDYSPVVTYFSTANEAYNPATNTWTSKARMPTGRYGLAAAALNGKVYAIGGYNDLVGVLGTVEVYDPTTNTWATRAPLPTPRTDLAAVTFNGKIYAIGGATTAGAAVATVEEYDPVADAWPPKTPLTTPRAGFAAVAGVGEVYVLAGQQNEPLAVVEQGDPAAGTWAAATSLATARNYLAAANLNGQLFAVGGYALEELAVVEETNVNPPPATGVTLTPSLPSPQAVGTPVVFTAAGQGSVGYEYRFWLFSNGVWNIVQDYGAAATWTLPSTTVLGDYSVAVWVRTNPSVDMDAQVVVPYHVGNLPATGVTLTPSLSSPQVVGTPVVFTAAGQGSSGYEYRFWLSSPTTGWNVVQEYSPSATWTLP